MNDKPASSVTLPVLTGKHVDFLRGLVLQLSDQFPAFQPFSDIEAVVRAIVSVEKVLVDRSDLVALNKALDVVAGMGLRDDAVILEVQRAFTRWLDDRPAIQEVT